MKISGWNLYRFDWQKVTFDMVMKIAIDSIFCDCIGLPLNTLLTSNCLPCNLKFFLQGNFNMISDIVKEISMQHNIRIFDNVLIGVNRDRVAENRGVGDRYSNEI